MNTIDKLQKLNIVFVASPVPYSPFEYFGYVKDRTDESKIYVKSLPNVLNDDIIVNEENKDILINNVASLWNNEYNISVNGEVWRVKPFEKETPQVIKLFENALNCKIIY